MNTHDLVDNFYEVKSDKCDHEYPCTCEAQQKLFDNLSELVQCYRRVDHNRNKVGDGGEVKIPLELLDHLDRKDKKNNPDLFGKLKAETSLEERERLNRYAKNFDTISKEIIQQLKAVEETDNDNKSDQNDEDAKDKDATVKMEVE